MKSTIIDIGPIKIYWYSIMILLGVIIGFYLVKKEAKRNNISEKKITDMLFYTMILGIIGARLYYCLFNLDYYSKNIIDIIKVWEGGLAIHGGIISGAIFIIYYTKKNKLNTLKVLDICIPGLLIGQTLGRWGNFFNQEAHGPITTLNHLKELHIPKFIIDGMKINQNYYIPTFFYESLWCLIGLIIILLTRKIKQIKIGQITGFYFIWYGIGRYLIESLRTDSLMLNTIKQAQLISIIMIIIGTIVIITSKSKEKYNS